MTSLLDDPMKNDSTTVKSAHSKGIASFLYAHRVDVEDPLRCILSTRLVIHRKCSQGIYGDPVGFPCNIYEKGL